MLHIWAKTGEQRATTIVVFPPPILFSHLPKVPGYWDGLGGRERGQRLERPGLGHHGRRIAQVSHLV